MRLRPLTSPPGAQPVHDFHLEFDRGAPFRYDLRQTARNAPRRRRGRGIRYAPGRRRFPPSVTIILVKIGARIGWPSTEKITHRAGESSGRNLDSAPGQ